MRPVGKGPQDLLGPLDQARSAGEQQQRVEVALHRQPRRQFARGERRLTGKQLRLLNEVPGLAAALIVVLVIVRPL